MFRSKREKGLVLGKQKIVAELNRLREAAEAGDEIDLATLANLSDEFNTCKSSECPRRVCFLCKEKFLPNEKMAELLVSWCVCPDGKQVIAGIHEQHFLNLCKECYKKLDLESLWQEYKDEEVREDERINR